MSDHEFEKLMPASAVRQAQIINNSLPSDEELDEIIPSESFEKSMRAILVKDDKRKQRFKNRKHVGKIAASFAIIVAISFGTIMSADASRITFIQFFERCFSISPVKNNVENSNLGAPVLSDLHNVYLPTWIPDQFKAFSSNTGSSGNCVVNYRNANNSKQFIRFSQRGNSISTLNDNDLQSFEKLTINDNIYFFGEKSISGDIERNLVWTYNDMYFTVSSSVSKDELIKLATSIKLKD